MNGTELGIGWVWLIPFLIVVTLVILYLLARRWRGRAEDELKNTRKELRNYQGQSAQIARNLQEYPIADQEPYRSIIESLRAQLERLTQKFTNLEHAYIQLQDQILKGSANPWKGLLGAPLFWSQERKEIAALQADVASCQEDISSAQQLAERLSNLGWEVAGQARQAQETLNNAHKVLEWLSSKNVHGDALDQVILREQQEREILSQIPEEFLQGQQAEFNENVDQATIIQVYQQVTQVQPLLVESLETLRSWEGQYIDAAKRINRLVPTLASLEGLLELMPERLDVRDYQKRLAGFQVVARNLRATLQRMQVDTIADVSTQAERIQDAAQEMEGELKLARHQYDELQELLSELTNGLKDLSAQFAALGTNQIHPVQWDQSRDKLTDLSRQLNALGPADRSRNPSELAEQLAEAKRLSDEMRGLQAHCQAIAQQHIQVVTLLGIPEVRNNAAWLQSARQLASRATLYAPDNWLRGDSVASLASDLDIMEGSLSDPIFSDLNKPLLESELEQRLDQACKIAETYQGMRERVQGIHNRLDELQALERQAGEALGGARNAITQLALLANSNAYLGELSTKELERLQSDLQSLETQLSERQQGNLEKKARAVDNLVGRINSAANNWLNKLSTGVQALVNELSAGLSDLDAIAILDESAVSKTRQQVSSAPIYAAKGAPQATSLEQTILELKQRSEYWQTCSATLNELRNIQGPLKDTFEAAQAERQLAQEELDDIQSWLKQTRDWPPASLTINAEQHEFDILESQWQSIKGSRYTAIELVQRLSQLGARYQTLTEKLTQSSERIAQQHQRVQEVEGEIDELIQSWQEHLRAYRDNPVTNQEIRELISHMDRELNQVKADYKRRVVNYEQVLQALKKLEREVRLAQVNIDDNHVLDVNGRMIAYR